MATKTTTRKEELRKLTSVKICAPRRRLLSRHISQVFVHLTSHFWMAICLFTLCDFRKFPLLLSSSSVLVAWSRFCHWLPSSECLFSFPFLFLCVGAAAGGRKPNQLSKKQKKTKKQTKKLHCCCFFSRAICCCEWEIGFFVVVPHLIRSWHVCLLRPLSVSVSSLDTGIYLSLHRGLLVLSLAASTRTITTSSSVRWCSLPSITPTFVCLSEHVSGNF